MSLNCSLFYKYLPYCAICHKCCTCYRRHRRKKRCDSQQSRYDVNCIWTWISILAQMTWMVVAFVGICQQNMTNMLTVYDSKARFVHTCIHYDDFTAAHKLTQYDRWVSYIATYVSVNIKWQYWKRSV